jgi:hypothetical protein
MARVTLEKRLSGFAEGALGLEDIANDLGKKGLLSTGHPK